MPPKLALCPACGDNNGLPNLRHCAREQAALEARYQAALAKLAARIGSTTTADQYPGLLMFCDGQRETDQFIEVHLFGPFTAQAIVAAHLPTSGKNRTENFYLDELQDKFSARGIPCQRH